MLIDHRGRLRAAVAIRAVEIEGGDAMLAKSAFEYSAAADRCGYVISHTFTVPLLPVLFWDKRCATLEQETLSLAGIAGGHRRTRTAIRFGTPRDDGSSHECNRSLS